MPFNSLQFALFFIIVFFLYLALKHKWQNRLLLLASCVFYAAWDWRLLGLVFISITTDYQKTVYEDGGYTALIKKLSVNKEFTYIPRTELPAFAEQDFGDSVHFNKRGRDILSTFIAEYLVKKGILARK